MNEMLYADKNVVEGRKVEVIVKEQCYERLENTYN